MIGIEVLAWYKPLMHTNATSQQSLSHVFDDLRKPQVCFISPQILRIFCHYGFEFENLESCVSIDQVVSRLVSSLSESRLIKQQLSL